MSLARRALAAALLLLAGGCANQDTVAIAVNQDRAAYCAAAGPSVLVDGACMGEVAARTFGRAVCACGALSLSGDLVTDGFDSRVAPWTPGGAGGDLGARGGLSFGGLLQVGGSLLVSGGGVEAGTTLHVAGDLDVGGPLGRPSTTATVGGAARIGGNIDVAALTVTGSLTTPPGASLAGAITAMSLATGAVSVPSACPCGLPGGVDVGAIVAQHAAGNHDAAIGLVSDTLAAITSDTTLELPCGRFYLDRIQGSAGVTIRATGRTALFIGADVTVSGSFVVELAPGAELDLFVAGWLNLPAAFRLGDPTRPGALRLWLAAGGALNVPVGSQLAAAVYAPDADLAAMGPLDVFGSLVVKHLLANAGALAVHYDRATVAAGALCGP